MNKKDIVLNILFETFYDNPASVGVVKQGSNRIKRFKLLLAYSYFLSSKFGNVYLSEDENACCLTIDSDKNKFSLKQLYWYFILAFRVIGVKNAAKVLKRMKTLREARPNGSHLYVWYVGVKKDCQRRGIGSKLLFEIIQMNPDRTICLEATKESNFPFYEKLGFEKYDQIDLNYSFNLYKLN